MKLSYWEKQLILYTKNHYKRIYYDNDLKYFPANLYGIGVDDVDLHNVLSMVVDLYQKLIDGGLINFTLETFISEIFRHSFRERGKISEVNYDDIIRHMLGEIQNIPVISKGLDLGDVDKELFVLFNNEI